MKPLHIIGRLSGSLAFLFLFFSLAVGQETFSSGKPGSGLELSLGALPQMSRVLLNNYPMESGIIEDDNAPVVFCNINDLFCLEWLPDLLNQFQENCDNAAPNQTINFDVYTATANGTDYIYANQIVTANGAIAFDNQIIYNCEGDIVDACVTAPVTGAVDCSPGPAMGAIVNALQNEVLIWSCGEPIPPCVGCDLSISTNRTNPSCGINNGSIQINVSGGTPPYQYSIGGAFTSNNFFNNLGAGTYFVTVRDNADCEETTTVVLQNQGSALSLSITPFPTSCSQNTGSINLQVSGGTPPYTYNWQPNQGNIQDPESLAAGFYTVTVIDANNCTASISTQVTVEACSPDDNPVCGADGNQYANPCEAICAGVGYTFGPCEDGPCICTADYNPVCGSDGVTYPNGCTAECAGIFDYEPGECFVDCFCPLNYDPVCGSDGNTYANACVADCAGVDWEPGECEEPCICPQIYDPVCGSDGLTYSNACAAECAGVDWEPGPCDTPCICEALYDPVCGSDGNTYSNSCYAECAGITEYTAGVCDEPCICEALYDPVCGVDGITYANACYAACAGVEVETEGACVDACNCPAIYDPVCGSDGLTYYNSCVAECANVDWTPGVCEQVCNCPAIYDPVCGSDGTTYQNACYAACAGVNWTPGICEELCICPANYDPVCGSDGNTYSNGCYAECAGIVDYTSGMCFPPIDNVLCRPWLRAIVDEFGVCGTNDDGGECGQTISLATYQGEVLVIVYDYCSFPFNNSYTETAYNLDGVALDICEGVINSINCGALPPNGAILENLTNTELIWSCGDDLPDCYCDLAISVNTTVPECGSNNGQVFIGVQSGAAPFVYQLGEQVNSTGLFTNLPEGVYNLSVTDDKGCVVEAYAVLLSEGYPNCLDGTITLLSDLNDCTNFSYQISGTFDDPCLSYSFSGYAINGNVLSVNVYASNAPEPCTGPGEAWSDTYSSAPLAAGDYTIRLLINFEFVTSITFTIEECTTACDLSLILIGTEPDCGLNNGAVSAIPNGGTPPYSYDFGNGFQSLATLSGLAAGTYSVTVMDGEDCTAENMVVLTCNPNTGGGGQTTFILGDAEVNQGENFCLPVSVVDFDDLLGMQFSINYDASILSYTGAQNFAPQLTGFGNASTANPSPGNLTFTWTDPLVDGVTLLDNSVLLELCFTATGNTTTEVVFSGTPTSIELINGNEDQVEFIQQNGTVTIIVPEPGNFGLEITAANACAGENFCLDISASSFTNISSFNFPVLFDPSALSLNEIMDVTTNLTDFSNANFTTPAAGEVAVQWMATGSPAALDPQENLFTICFEKLTNTASTVNIQSSPNTQTTVVDGNGDDVPFADLSTVVTSDGCTSGDDDQDGDGYSSTVDCDDTNPDINPGAEEIPGNNVDENCDDIIGTLPTDLLTFIGGDATGGEGDTVMIPVTVQNFNNISGFQFTMVIPEPSQGTFVEFVPSAALTGISVNPANGIFRVIWNIALGAPPLDLPDDTIIFWVKVRLNGAPGDCSIFSFSNVPTAISAVEGLDNSFVPATISGTFCVRETVNISGLIMTEYNLAVSNTEVGSPDGQVFVTAADGAYSFSELPADQDYVIEPHRNIEHSVGVTVGDIVLIRAHIIGFQDLNSPYKIIAADATGDDIVTVLDLITLQRLVIGFLDTLPNNESWRFVPENYDFLNPLAPLEEDFPESLRYTNLTTDVTDGNFVGIKVGDVNEDVILAAQNGTSTALQTTDQEYAAGEILNIPLSFADRETPAGWQFAFHLPADEFELLGINGPDGVPLPVDQYHHDKQLLRVIWFDNDPGKARQAPAEASLQLRVKALRSGQLSKTLALASKGNRISDDQGRETIINNLVFLSAEAAFAPLQVSTCYPLPFREKCTLTLTSTRQEFATLKILSPGGALVWQSHQELLPGVQSWEIPADRLPSAGLYFYQLQTATSSHTGKLIHNR